MAVCVCHYLYKERLLFFWVFCVFFFLSDFDDYFLSVGIEYAHTKKVRYLWISPQTLPVKEWCVPLNMTHGPCPLLQVVPAEGLVSILKKRNDTVGDHSAQMQQKPSKRKVRFQEIDDSLDPGKLLHHVQQSTGSVFATE